MKCQLRHTFMPPMLSQHAPVSPPISIRKDSFPSSHGHALSEVELPGVTLAFPNGVRAHFGRGSEGVLMEVLTQSMM